MDPLSELYSTVPDLLLAQATILAGHVCLTAASRERRGSLKCPSLAAAHRFGQGNKEYARPRHLDGEQAAVVRQLGFHKIVALDRDGEPVMVLLEEDGLRAALDGSEDKNAYTTHEFRRVEDNEGRLGRGLINDAACNPPQGAIQYYIGDVDNTGTNLPAGDILKPLLASRFDTTEAENIPGFTSVYLHVSAVPRSGSGMHAEDFWFPSNHVLASGRPKVWLSLSRTPDNLDKLERLCHELYGQAVRAGTVQKDDKDNAAACCLEDHPCACPQCLRHKAMVTSPDALDEAGVEYRVVPQLAPEIIATLAGQSYHQVVNEGPNIASAINSRLLHTGYEERDRGECAACSAAGCGNGEHPISQKNIDGLRPLKIDPLDETVGAYPRPVLASLFAPRGVVTLGQTEARATLDEHEKGATGRRERGRCTTDKSALRSMLADLKAAMRRVSGDGLADAQQLAARMVSELEGKIEVSAPEVTRVGGPSRDGSAAETGARRPVGHATEMQRPDTAPGAKTATTTASGEQGGGADGNRSTQSDDGAPRTPTRAPSSSPSPSLPDLDTLPARATASRTANATAQSVAVADRAPAQPSKANTARAGSPRAKTAKTNTIQSRASQNITVKPCTSTPNTLATKRSRKHTATAACSKQPAKKKQCRADIPDLPAFRLAEATALVDRRAAAMEAGEVFGDNEDGEGDDEDDAEEVW
ncbi:hypothetical protein NKR19_g3433 [Coniochaeta hoffmannii]|uniref:JmjC domain-containing protein n=1 Tax=Coniochaeta hoffmannii TaxID=91930 RepID=A0AA38SGV6_9PEZI|nr:hypothetical protein NKR19_g3433 [Coniochaeta hoffmannii]